MSVVEDIEQTLRENSSVVEMLCQQLDSALKEIVQLKKLIKEQAEPRRQKQPLTEIISDGNSSEDREPQSSAPARVEIERIRKEIQDSFRNLKNDYEEELQMKDKEQKDRREQDRHHRDKEKQLKFKSSMDVIEEQPETTSPPLPKLTRTAETYPTYADQPLQRTKTTMKISENLKYQGEISKGKFDGFGIISHGELEIYVGSFKNGIFQGQGRLINTSYLEVNAKLPFAQWVSYSGEFSQGTFHGMGTLVLNQTQKYLGRFVKGSIQGQGVYYRYGDIELGRWEKNRFYSLL